MYCLCINVGHRLFSAVFLTCIKVSSPRPCTQYWRPSIHFVITRPSLIPITSPSMKSQVLCLIFVYFLHALILSLWFCLSVCLSHWWSMSKEFSMLAPHNQIMFLDLGRSSKSTVEGSIPKDGIKHRHPCQKQ